MGGVLKESKKPKVESPTHIQGDLWSARLDALRQTSNLAKLGGLFENCVYNREPGDRSELGEGRGGRASSPALHTPPTN